MISAKLQTGVLAGAILTVTAISMPAHATTIYNTNFQVFGADPNTPALSITGQVTYNGPLTLTDTFQDLSLDAANQDLTYNWDIADSGGSIGNFTDANSFFQSFSRPPINLDGFPNPFQISQNFLVLGPLEAGDIFELFINETTPNPLGIAFEGSANTNGVPFVLGEVAPVPTPALLPGLLGFGATIVRRKKKQSEAAA